MSHLDDYHWLLSDDGQAACAKVTEQQVSPAQIRLLRKDHSVDRVRLIASLCELRWKARSKFINAEQLFMTDRSLQQATDSWTASYKASKMPPGEWVDACSGMGGDLMQMARKQNTTFIDQDPVLCLFAAANVERSGGHARSLVAQVESDDVCGRVLHIDPDRRTDQRTTQLQYMSPDFDTLEGLRAKAEWFSVKLAPATQVPARWDEASIREWIEWNGEVRQQWIRFGESQVDLRTATIVHRVPSQNGVPAFSYTSWSGNPLRQCEAASQFETYVYEPSRCLLAARLGESYAAEQSWKQPITNIPYYTSTEGSESRLATRFRVQAVMPYDQRRVKQWLRQHNCGRLTVKKRGTQLRPEQLQKQLRVDGDEPITLILAGQKDGITAILCERDA